MRTVNPKAASLRHAARETNRSRDRIKAMLAKGELSCVSVDPLQFNMDTLRKEIKARDERLLKEIQKKGE